MSYTQKETDLIVADSIRGLTYKQKKLLLASQFKENPNCGKYAEALIKACGERVYNKAVETFYDKNYAKKLLQGLDKSGVVCVTYKSQGYPKQLREIPVPPLVLYARGNVELLNGDKFGVVGSRKTLPAVYEECKKICGELSEKLVIVTGVAAGADSAAAYGALPSGNVICVLPDGHDGSFSNAKLLKEVERRGLTISEFPPKTSARKYTFFLRNRIIAGLSRGVLVVSAAEKSGALNTASYAADYGRDVFAFPYGLGISSGEGCNNLIKKGAALCDCAKDILFALGYDCSGGEEKAAALDKDEEAVLTLLKNEGEMHIEKIADALKKPLFEVNALCASLEIKGLLARAGGNKFSAL